jgi:hypothetical protein
MTVPLLWPGAGRADVVYTFSTPGDGNDPTSDGHVSARATFSTFTGLVINGTSYNGIQIVIDNLELLNGGNGEGQSISGITFSVGGGLASSATGLVQDQGLAAQTYGTNVNPLGTVTGTSSSSPAFEHWGSALSGNNTGVTLETAGTAAQAGKPKYLIVGALTNGGSYNASYLQHDPNFYLSATFWVADPNVNANTVLTTSNITNVQFAFGTGPSFGGPATGSNSPPPVVVPAPSTAVLSVLGLAALAPVGLLRRGRSRFLALA